MKKLLTIMIIPLVIGTSLFMILESGEYYSTFYSNDLYKGYWSAALVECFLTLFAVLHFKKSPYLNFGLKFIMVFLFIGMIGGASLKIISPLLDELSTSKNNDKLVNFLLAENKTSKANLALLKGQKTNTAIQARYQREISQELKTELKKSGKAGWMIWIPIIFTAFLRLSIQTANLILAHILGEQFRINFKTKRKYKKKDTKFWKLPKLKIAKGA